MATVYVKNVPSSSWSRTTWDDTGSTNYVAGDRVTLEGVVINLNVHGSIDDPADYIKSRTYVCTVDNSSTTSPFDNTSQWTVAGSSPEYPSYAVDGNICNDYLSEVYLEHTSTRYSNKSVRTHVWRQATVEGTEHGELVFEDGDYNDGGLGFTIDKLSFTAKNSGKVSISTAGVYQYIFQGNVRTTGVSRDIARMTGIKFIIGGSLALISNNEIISFDSCIITDRGSANGTYSPSSYRIGTNSQYLDLKNTLIDLPNSTVALMGFQSAAHDGAHGTFEGCTFYTGAGNTNQYLPVFYSNPAPFPVVKKCIFAFITSAYQSNDWQLGLATGSSENTIYCYDQNVPQPKEEPAAILQDPLFVDSGNGDFRLRPSSPLIGGLETSNSNPAGVYIQPGSSTGGSGTFEDPYYMAELDTAETEAAAGNGIIYFVDGYYEISNGLNLYADEITYKSLNKHKAILGSSDIHTTNAKKINIGGQYGTTNLGVGNITLEDFYIKNTRFQQATNSASRPNKIKGLKIEDTHPIGHATDGFLWSYGKLIIESCFIYLDFAQESSYYLTRGSDSCEMLNTTLIINFSQTSGHVSFVTFGSIENSIIYAIDQIPESGFGNLTANSKNCCFYNIGSNITYGGENTYQGDPKFTDPNSRDFRLRADSPLIGGITQSKYPADAIWIQPGSGTGSGTKDDPYSWAEYSAAFLATTQSSSKQLIFKDGTYIWTNAILQDDNVGNNITMVAENMHQAIFTDNNSRVASDGKNPTLRFKGIQMLATDHFTWQPTCHYIFDSCHILVHKYIGAISVTASGTIFEVQTGQNTYIFSNSGPVDIKSCIFVDHNDRQSNNSYLTGAVSGTIKSCIFYVKYSRDTCIDPSHNAVLIKCATENITNPENGVSFIDNLGFVDIENKNYSLRPKSPLIGRG